MDLRISEGSSVGGVDSKVVPSGYAIGDSQALLVYSENDHGKLLHAVGPVTTDENETTISNHISEEIDSNSLPTQASTSLMPYYEYKGREGGRNSAEIDVRRGGFVERNSVADVDFDKSPVNHVAAVSQCVSFYGNVVNGETVSTIIKENDLEQSYSPSIEVAVNPLFSSSEEREREAMEVDELPLSDGIKTHSSLLNKPKEVLECVLREMRESEGNIFFRVKRQVYFICY
nr:hypothetical transcript [Hymenolepis microstoma]